MKKLCMIMMGVVALGATTAHADDPQQQFWQPPDERKAQATLPMASGPLWQTLLQSKIHYSDKEPHITASLTPDIKALESRSVTVDGFMLPIGTDEYSKHFLLSKRTPTCPFCPPGEPNEVLDVYADPAVKATDDMLTMTGTFHLVNETDQGIFFVLKNAKQVAKSKPHYKIPFLNP